MVRINSANTKSSCTDRRSYPEQIEPSSFEDALRTILLLYNEDRTVTEEKQYKEAFVIKRKYQALTNKYNGNFTRTVL